MRPIDRARVTIDSPYEVVYEKSIGTNPIGPQIGNGLWGIQWSSDRWRHVTWKVKLVTSIIEQISQKRLKIETPFQRTTN